MRIRRSRIPDSLATPAALRVLVTAQRRLLDVLVGTILVTFCLDLLFDRYGPSIAKTFGAPSWLLAELSLPSDDTLRNLLTAAAGATGAVLALVVSISLIAWQTTAERYRSGRIVEFLLRERVGSSVVQLLALGFSLSLWVLATMEVVDGVRPYASSLMALLVSTMGVISLLTYQRHALLGYVPRSMFSQLAGEIHREVRRASRRGAGRSVEDRARRVVDDDLLTFGDLFERLHRDREPSAIAAGVLILAEMSSVYLSSKRYFRSEALWFARRSVLLQNDWQGVGDEYTRRGLPRPISQEPDHVWFERRVLDLVAGVARTDLLQDPEVYGSLFALWRAMLQAGWDAEELEVVDLVLHQLEDSASHAFVSDGLVGNALEVARVLQDVSTTGLPMSAEAIVDSRPWTSLGKRPLGPVSRMEARDLATKVRHEVAVTGRTVTPRSALVAEVEASVTEAVRASRDLYARRSLRLACDLLGSSVGRSEIRDVAAIAEAVLRLLVRCAHRGLPIDLSVRTEQDLLKAHQVTSDPNRARELRDGVALAAHVFAEHQRWDIAFALTDVAIRCCIDALGRDAIADAEAMSIGTDAVLSLALVHAWGEFYGEPDHVLRLGGWVSLLPLDFDGAGLSVQRHGSRVRSFLMSGGLRYQGWFQPLRSAAHALPDIPFREPDEIGYSTRKDHASSLFWEWDHADDPSDCVNHFLDAVMDTRTRLQGQLLTGFLSLLRSRS